VSEEHERIIDDLAAYALESLEAPGRARVETHVATCPTCASRLAEYRAVVGALPIGLEPVAPPPAAWAAIRAAARARRPPARRWARAVFLPDWLRAARWPALAAAVVSLVVWNVMLQGELARRPPGPEVEALARRPGRLVILTGTGTPGASGRLLVAVDGVHGHLAVAGLKPLPPERTYQLWFVRPGARTATGGTFAVDGRGRAWATITVPVSLDEARAIVVTEEPAPGSAAPTGSDLLNAQSWR
jgi:anti-sigma-K factor RskA